MNGGAPRRRALQPHPPRAPGRHPARVAGHGVGRPRPRARPPQVSKQALPIPPGLRVHANIPPNCSHVPAGAAYEETIRLALPSRSCIPTSVFGGCTPLHRTAGGSGRSRENGTRCGGASPASLGCCTRCAPHLPGGNVPVSVLHQDRRHVLVGQPGPAAHAAARQQFLPWRRGPPFAGFHGTSRRARVARALQRAGTKGERT